MDIIIPNDDTLKQIKLGYYKQLRLIVDCLIKLCSPDIVYTGSQYTQQQIENNINKQLDILEKHKQELDVKHAQVLSGFALDKLQSETTLDESANIDLTIDIKQEEVPSLPCLEAIESNNSEAQNVNKEKEDINPLYCPVCDLTFKSEDNFIKDIEFHFSQRCTQCNDCYISTKGYHRCFKIHQIIFDRYKEAIKCNNCSFATLTKERLDDHSKQCNKTDVFFIETGSKIASNIITNSKQTRYYCGECNQYFKNGQALGGHRSRKHSTKQKNNVSQMESSKNIKNRAQTTYGCADNAHSMKSHQSISNVNEAIKGEMHQCHVCAMIFHSHFDLDAHFESFHKSESSKLYKCDHCKYETPNKSSLIVHNRSHTNERPYKCSIGDCKKDFTTSGNLKAHIKKVHDNKRNYQCLYCPLAFNASYDLRVHQYIHTGEKPYKCGFCAESFNKSDKKNKHEKDKHIGWKCPFCEEKFDAEYQLNNHRKTIHPNMKIIGGTKWLDYGCEKCERRFKTAEEADAHYAQCTIDVKATNDLDEIRKDVTAKCDNVKIVEIDIVEIKKALDGKNKKKKNANEDEPYVPRTKSIETMNGKRRKSKRLNDRKIGKKSVIENVSINGKKRRWNVDEQIEIDGQPSPKKRKIKSLKLKIRKPSLKRT